MKFLTIEECDKGINEANTKILAMKEGGNYGDKDVLDVIMYQQIWAGLRSALVAGKTIVVNDQNQYMLVELKHMQ